MESKVALNLLLDILDNKLLGVLPLAKNDLPELFMTVEVLRDLATN